MAEPFDKAKQIRKSFVKALQVMKTVAVESKDRIKLELDRLNPTNERINVQIGDKTASMDAEFLPDFMFMVNEYEKKVGRPYKLERNITVVKRPASEMVDKRTGYSAAGTARILMGEQESVISINEDEWDKGSKEHQRHLFVHEFLHGDRQMLHDNKLTSFMGDSLSRVWDYKNDKGKEKESINTLFTNLKKFEDYKANPDAFKDTKDPTIQHIRDNWDQVFFKNSFDPRGSKDIPIMKETAWLKAIKFFEEMREKKANKFREQRQKRHQAEKESLEADIRREQAGEPVRLKDGKRDPEQPGPYTTLKGGYESE